MSPQHFSDTHLDELAAIMDFTRADLAANRRGRLTARQIARLQTDRHRQHRPTLVAWFALSGLVIALAMLHLELAAEWLIVFAGMAVFDASRLNSRNDG